MIKSEPRTVLIQGFEMYSLNELGVVINTTNGFVRKHVTCEGHYPKVRLQKDKKGFGLYIHRLLAIHFIPNPKNYPLVHHKDGDKTNFSLDNLEWCDYSYNILEDFKSGRRVLTEKQMEARRLNGKKVMVVNTETGVFLQHY